MLDLRLSRRVDRSVEQEISDGVIHVARNFGILGRHPQVAVDEVGLRRQLLNWNLRRTAPPVPLGEMPENGERGLVDCFTH